MAARVLLIDNYDSFTYNLVQELGELGADPVVYRNDAIDVGGIREIAPDGVIISPGPGRP
ncbi:MAG: glutamine amidotransferase-related protein, partial [Acidimicrobiales bacterium]